MYSVWDHTLITDKGKELVINHELDQDGQLVYAELVHHYTHSIDAVLKADELREYITSVAYSNSWKGNSATFIRHWKAKVKEYNELQQDPNDRLSDNIKMTTLQNAVRDVAELHAVKTMAVNYALQNNSKLDFVTYLSLLENRAAQYDRDIAKSKSKGRNINQHSIQAIESGDYIEFADSSSEMHDHDDFPENIAEMSPDQFLSINKIYSRPKAKSLNNNRPKIPRSLYLKNPEKWRNMDFETLKALSEYCLEVDSEFKKEQEKYTSKSSQSYNKNFKSDQHRVVWDDDVDQDESTNLITALINRGKTTDTSSTRHPGDVRQLMSINKVHQETQSSSEDKTIPPEGIFGPDLHINGQVFRRIHNHILVRDVDTNTTYIVSNHKRVQALEQSLVDGGANGGVGGANSRLMSRDPIRTASLTGVDDHQVEKLPIGQCAGKVRTKNRGYIIGLLNQYAYLGRGPTIHSKGQLQHFKNIVCDSSKKVGGKQCITTIEGYIIPLSIKDGLPYMEMTYPTDEDLLKYPHVVLTSDVDWDPSCLDCDGEDVSYTSDNEDDYDDTRIDSVGNYTGRVVNMLSQLWDSFKSSDSTNDDDSIDYGSYIFDTHHVFATRRSKRLAHQKLPTKATLPESTDSYDDLPFTLEELGFVSGPNTVSQHDPTIEKLEELQPKLGYAPLSIIKQTLKNTTCFY
jgi:hypothetical protein